MRHFAHHIGDYAAATAHLSFVEDAAYHRLLRLVYRDEGPLPSEIAACQRLAGARSKDERAAIETVLREFFSLRDDGWHQGRADEEIAGYRAKAEAARENGLLGGRPRTKSKPVNNQSGFSQAPDEKLTTNHEPVTNLTTTPCVSNSNTHRQSVLISIDWLPSEHDIAQLRKARPDLIGPLYDQRMQDFREWCRSAAVTSHHAPSTWSSFMRKTRAVREGAGSESYADRRAREAQEAIERSKMQ